MNICPFQVCSPFAYTRYGFLIQLQIDFLYYLVMEIARLCQVRVLMAMVYLSQQRLNP